MTCFLLGFYCFVGQYLCNHNLSDARYDDSTDRIRFMLMLEHCLNVAGLSHSHGR